MKALGCDDLICKSESDLVKKILELSEKPNEILRYEKLIREKIYEFKSNRPEAFTKNLEKAMLGLLS